MALVGFLSLLTKTSLLRRYSHMFCEFQIITSVHNFHCTYKERYFWHFRIVEVPDLDRTVEGGREEDVFSQRMKFDDLNFLGMSGNDELGLVNGIDKSTGWNFPVKYDKFLIFSKIPFVFNITGFAISYFLL